MENTPNPVMPKRVVQPACLGKVEGALPFLNGNTELFAEDLHTAVIGHLEVIDTSHNTWKIIVRRVWRLARLADDRKHWSKVLEA